MLNIDIAAREIEVELTFELIESKLFIIYPKK